MKKILLCAVVVVLSLSVNLPFAQAVPVSNSGTDLDYIIDDSSLHRWCFGVYALEQDIDIKIKSNNFTMILEQQKAMAYLGYNIFSWMMVYGTIGESENRLDGWQFVDPAHELEYGAGFQVNILSREIPDPTLFENKLRITAGAQYTVASTDVPGAEWRWAEVTAHVTLSIVNDIAGNKLFLPNSIALYGGPIYSDIISDDIVQLGDEFGYNLGLEVFYTESVSFDIGLRKLSDTGVTAGLHVRF